MKRIIICLIFGVTFFVNIVYAEENSIDGPMEMWDNKGNYFVINEDGSYYFEDRKGNVQIKDEDGSIFIKDKDGYTYNFNSGDNSYLEFSDIWYGINSVGSVSGGPGVAKKDGWMLLDDNRWIYIENGKAITNSWKQYNGDWYYFDGEGNMVIGWQYINGKLFYFNQTGAMATGEQFIDGYDREFSAEGVLIY